MKRVIVAGLLAGLALFAWESVAHLVLPLGAAGVKGLDNAQVLSSLRNNVKEDGLYIFPMQANGQASQTASGPAGIMVVQPNGTMAMMPSQLVIQLAADVVAMLLAAALLVQAGGFPGFGKRVVFFTLMGILPALRTDLSYWNWYAFPAVYTAAQFAINIVGFCLGGLVIAKMVGTPSTTPRNAREARAAA